MGQYTFFLVFFVIIFLVCVGGTILALRWVFVSSVEGAKQRLERDAEAARAREAELNRKIRQADEELVARKKELDQLEQKMKGELEAEANKHRDELVNKARAEAEDIITKAQNAADGLRRDIQKQMELKIVDYSAKIIEEVLTKKAKVAFEKDLIEEFIAQLNSVDMSKISLDIKSANVVTVTGISESELKRVADIVRTKTGREITLQPKIDGAHVAGVIIQFGSLMLDGSVRHAIKESALALKTDIEKGQFKK